MASSPANRRDKRPEAHRLAAEGDIDGSFSFFSPPPLAPNYLLFILLRLYYSAFIFHSIMALFVIWPEGERVHGQQTQYSYLIPF
jgi:hypothetical protein